MATQVSNIQMGPDGSVFDIIVSPRDGEPVRYEGLKMPMAGHHNVLNATAAVAVARELGVDAFILAGNPHLEEAYRVGEEVLPLLQRTPITPSGLETR